MAKKRNPPAASRSKERKAPPAGPSASPEEPQGTDTAEAPEPDTGTPGMDPDPTAPEDTPPDDTAGPDDAMDEPGATLDADGATGTDAEPDPDADDGEGDDGVGDALEEDSGESDATAGAGADAGPHVDADTDANSDADADACGEAVDSDAVGDGVEPTPDAESSTEPGGGKEGDAAAFDLPLESVVEAILFSTNKPLKIGQIAKAAGTRIRQERVAEAIAVLNRVYEESGRAFEIVEVAETFQMMSRPEFAPYLHTLLGKPTPEKEKEKKYSPAALDTLSIIAYKQPITRADVEAIRGVGCGPIMRQLMERGMIRVVGKKTDIIGHPLLYGTTPEFLKEFGLGTLESLPMIHEFRRMTGSTDPIPPVGQPHVQLTLVEGAEGADGEDAPESGGEALEDGGHDGASLDGVSGDDAGQDIDTPEDDDSEDDDSEDDDSEDDDLEDDDSEDDDLEDDDLEDDDSEDDDSEDDDLGHATDV